MECGPTANGRTNAMALVSIAVVCYKQGQFLREAIESVLAQTYPRYELIIVDDGSPDDTRTVAQEYAKRSNKLRYVYQDHRGVATARNRGFEESRGTYLIMFDADDRLLPHHLARGLQAFEQHPDAAAVCGDYRIIGQNDALHVHRCEPAPDFFGTLLATSPALSGTVMLRADVVRRLGGVREVLKANCEYDLFLRVAKDYPMYCHHDVIMEYRRHPTQRTKDHALMFDSFMRVLEHQRHYVHANPRYRAAYNLARRHHLENCGEFLMWQTVAAVKAGHLSRAARGLGLLLRWYPRGLARFVLQRLQSVVGIKTIMPSP
jgi:glycosyltransferase involved in cell wall biosynthesis